MTYIESCRSKSLKCQDFYSILIRSGGAVLFYINPRDPKKKSKKKHSNDTALNNKKDSEEPADSKPEIPYWDFTDAEFVRAVNKCLNFYKKENTQELDEVLIRFLDILDFLIKDFYLVKFLRSLSK